MNKKTKILTEKDIKNINNAIASAKHEGYEDDGFMRDVLTKLAKGEITEEEVDKLILSHK